MRELLVSRSLFLEVTVKHVRTVAASELLGPRHECTITGDFIVFHGLRGRN